jgi:nucleoside-diphosphate-sugar epimerase
MPDGSVLVTRTAGFIGFDVARRLWRDGCDVVGLNNTRPRSEGGVLGGARHMQSGMAKLLKKFRFPHVIFGLEIEATT